jgi:hypothetical protein
MSEQEQEQTEVWPFARSYESSYSSLPPSLEPPEVEAADELTAGVDDITTPVAELSLEPAEVVAALAQPEPEPEPEPVKPAPSKPIPVPSRIPAVRQQPPAAAAAPRNQPKKGLAGRFA